MQLRWQGGSMYLDESGQFPPRADELPIVASLLVPDNPADRARLADAARMIRLDARRHEKSKGRAKPQFMSDFVLDHVAAMIREHWFVGYKGIEPSPDRREMMTSAFSTLPDEVAKMRAKLVSSGDRADLRIDWLISQLRAAIASQAEYFALVFGNYLISARWFRENGIRPFLRAYLDDKLPRVDTLLHDFLIRFTFSTVYPELYGGRLASLLGVRPCPEFRAEVSSDDETDGLAVVGVVAWVRGMIDRGMDPAGRFKRLFGLMTRAA